MKNTVKKPACCIAVVSAFALFMVNVGVLAAGVHITMPSNYKYSSAATNPNLTSATTSPVTTGFISNGNEPKAGTVGIYLPPIGPTPTKPAQSAESNGLSWNGGGNGQVAFNWGKGIAPVKSVRLTVTNPDTGFKQSITCSSDNPHCVIDLKSLKDYTMNLDITVDNYSSTQVNGAPR